MKSVAFLIALVCLFLISGWAQAGPIRDRLKARFGKARLGRGGQPVRVYAEPQVQAQPAYLTSPGLYYATPHRSVQSCPGGVCPAPAKVTQVPGVFS